MKLKDGYERCRARTVYVAFNDPDDGLGFRLPSYLADTSPFGAAINVTVHNPGVFKLETWFKWLSVPFLYKSLSAAHSNQADNPAIIEAMVEGLALPKRTARQ